LTFLETGMDAGYPLFGFDPGPTARSAGPWTRLRRSFAWPQAAIVDTHAFDPGLNVQVAGPWTRLRRSGSDLPALGMRAAPVAAAVVGTVVLTSTLARPRAEPNTSVASALPAAIPAPETRVEPIMRPRPIGEFEARLVGSEAVLPEGAPQILKDVVAAANQIEGRPYSYGGGHGSFASSGYDCSGAVSYALHGGGLLESPLASGSFTGWGEAGEGKAITVYANGGHAFAVIAGLRWDTSGTGSSGPSWHADMRSGAGFVARHPRGY
jgi:cell wall-associated NlpC family hydrolase